MMGLLDTVKARGVAETGMDVVDGNGKSVAHFGVNNATTGERVALTNEYEIMRGDLVSVFYEESLKQRASYEKEGGKEGGLRYEFGKTITELTKGDDGVDVTFSDGQKSRFDLVVGADGQHSRTRRLAFGQEGGDQVFKPLGVHTAYYTIPRVEGEGGLAKIYMATGSRAVMTRNGDRPMTQVYFFVTKESDRLKKTHKEPIEKQKEVWADIFKDAGWQSDRFVSGLNVCNDFYAHEVAQVKIKKLYSGRVVLLGDAGYCPTPFTGMGTTASLIGAYVLAGELAKHGNDVGMGLKAYEDTMWRPIEECQRLSMGSQISFPSSQLGVWLARTAFRAVSSLRIDRIMKVVRAFLPEGKHDEWKIPEYPELNLVS